MKSRQFILMTQAALLFTAGCTFGPDYVRPGVTVPATFKEAEGWKQAQPRDQEARGKWWEIFSDPILSGLEEEVSTANQTLAQAEANYRQAAALIYAAEAAYYPTVTGGLSNTRSRASSTTIAQPSATPVSRSVVQLDSLRSDASWVPDFWGRVQRTVESNTASAQANAALVESARLSAQAQLAQSYFQLRVNDGQRRLYDDMIAGYSKALQVTQNQYLSGVVARSDVITAQAQLRSVQAQAIDLGVQRAQLEHAIAILVGKAPADFRVAPVTQTIAPPPVPVELPSALLERRPDIAAAERRVAAANAQIGVAKAAYFPTVTLSASGGFQSASKAPWLTLPSRFWSLGPSLAETLFDGGLRRSQTDQATAAYDASVAAYRQAVLTGFQQVEDNLSALRILEQEAAVQDEAVKAANQALGLALNQYRAGVISYLPVVVAHNNALNNLNAAASVLSRRMVASVSLVTALGGDWSSAELPDARTMKSPGDR